MGDETRRLRITYQVIEYRECYVDATGRQDAIHRFDRGEVEGDRRRTEYGLDLDDAMEVLFDPPQECVREGCSNLIGPSDDSPTPDEYCSLYCAVMDAAVCPETGRRLRASTEDT